MRDSDLASRAGSSARSSTQESQKRSSERDCALPRVLIVAPTLRYMGGQAVIAAQLVHAMGCDGLRVDFLPVDPELPRILHFARRLKYLRTVAVSSFYLVSLMRNVPRHDLIHIFSASYASFIIAPTPAILVSRIFGKLTLLNYHSGEAEDHLRRWKKIIFPILRMSDRIVVPSDYLVQVFATFGFPAVAISNVVEENLFAYRERKYAEPRIIVARALEPEYDVACAIRAFGIVKQREPRAEMTILGNGSQRSKLEKLVRTLDVRGVTFAGRIERDRIGWFYDQHDLFLNSSAIDNMPLSILEAFAAGLPVVTTNAGGIPFIIKDRQNGHMVDVGDHESLAERLLELINRPEEVHRLSQRGREEIQKYRWEAVSKRWYDLYAEMIGRATKITMGLG